MPAPDNDDRKTPSGKAGSTSRWRWLKKPAVWVAGLVTVVIGGVLTSLATGATSHIFAAGPVPNIEVDSVTAQYLSSPSVQVPARPVQIDFEIRNTAISLPS